MRLLVLALAALPSAAWAQSSATFRGADVYRSASFDEAKLEALRPRLVLYTELRDSRRKANQRAADKLKKDLLEKVSAMGSFAFADLHFGQYVTSTDHSAYLTFDLVDRADAEARMPFLPAPDGRVPDPEGLLAAWQQYTDAGQSARSVGAAVYERPKCPAFFCSYGSQTPELAAFEKRFVEGAPRSRKALALVLEREADPRKRAAACYVASYLPEGAEVVNFMVRALRDPDVQVRGAALEVLSDIATYHREVRVEPNSLLPVLDYPTTSDRSKALGVFMGLADNPDHLEFVKRKASPSLLRLLRQRQPSVHDLAFTILALISKEPLGRRDYEGWSRWVESQTPKDGR